MKSIEYDFEYTDIIYKWKLLGICFLIFLISYLISAIFARDFFREIKVGVMLIEIIVAHVGMVVLIFWLNKKNIRRKGSASIFEEAVNFKLHHNYRRILFSDIKSYRTSQDGGARLWIQSDVDKEFHIAAETAYCDSKNFELFFEDFIKIIKTLGKEIQVETDTKQTTSRKAYLIGVLILPTIICILGYLIAYYDNQNIPLNMIMATDMIILQWIIFFYF